MRIGELAEECQCPVETIRYYEKIGLLPKPRRRASGYRDYDEHHRRWLQFILRSRALGFSQSDVRRLNGLWQAGMPCAEVHAMLCAHLQKVDDKLADLRRMRRSLVRLRDRCEQEDQDECPAIDELMR